MKRKRATEAPQDPFLDTMREHGACVKNVRVRDDVEVKLNTS
jgi:hypothetical protein